MTSPRQRAANRVNALKSTGPKTPRGRARASLNATKHGLTQPIDASPWGDHLCAIADLLITDGLVHPDALDLAKKILDLERNLDYQRKRFEHTRETVSTDAPCDAIVEGEAGADSNLVGDFGQLAGLPIDSLGEFATDLWVAETLDKWVQTEEPLFEEKLDLEIAKFLRKTVEARLAEARRAELQKLRAADRHLRRSALQLSKAIKTKGEATGEATDIQL